MFQAKNDPYLDCAFVAGALGFAGRCVTGCQVGPPLPCARAARGHRAQLQGVAPSTFRTPTAGRLPARKTR